MKISSRQHLKGKNAVRAFSSIARHKLTSREKRRREALMLFVDISNALLKIPKRADHVSLILNEPLELIQLALVEMLRIGDIKIAYEDSTGTYYSTNARGYLHS